MVAHAVREWINDGAVPDALALPEPWFAGEDGFNAPRPAARRVCEARNPDDNHGLRHLLWRRYFELDRIDDALALTARYPDDYATTRHGRALALFVQMKPGLATGAMREAVVASPKFLAWLRKPNPKAPRSGRYGIEIGGNEEAWLYREEWLGLWQRFGALDWARQLTHL